MRRVMTGVAAGALGIGLVGLWAPAAHADGLAVPGDVRIVGTDGLSLGSLTVPPLSSLDVIHCGLAEAVTDLIERVLDGTAEPSEHVTVTPLPLWRESA